jgi:hypothetical protein
MTLVYMPQTAKSLSPQEAAARAHCYQDIKINEDKFQTIYFSHRLRSLEAHLPLTGWNIPFVNHLNYLAIIFDKRFTWRLYIEMIEAKAFRKCIRIYSLFKSER